ncbi:MAG: L-histidine N(alpha)-methyltransferase [Spirulinaceae cyanobacterium]
MSTYQSAKENPSLAVKEHRLEVRHLLKPDLELKVDDGKDVIAGLSKTTKSLSPRYFYDEVGSQLFEKICELPEYYLTRTEGSLLKQYAPETARLTGACELVELGSGSSTKTRFLLDAYQELSPNLRYIPIDVSAEILEHSARQLLQDYTSLQIEGLVATYEQALAKLNPSSFPSRLVFFLGSTLGNLSPEECNLFLEKVNNSLEPGDYFLLGIDLQKPQEVLEAAYNDSQGITAAFNLNMLRHLNWRFRGDFNLSLFSHHAIYNTEKSQIELYLVSEVDQTVCLKSLDLEVKFKQKEAILTEISRKFDLQKMQQYLSSQGLNSLQVWADKQGWFGLLLCQK